MRWRRSSEGKKKGSSEVGARGGVGDARWYAGDDGAVKRGVVVGWMGDVVERRLVVVDGGGGWLACRHTGLAAAVAGGGEGGGGER